MSQIAYITFRTSLLLAVVMVAELQGVEKIRFTAEKGSVVSIAEREVVLNAANRYLGAKDDEVFLSSLGEVQVPYKIAENTDTLMPVAESPAEADTNVVDAPSEPEIVYDDASVLKVISENFSKQVRGTLSRGESSYVQLQGGGLLKEGASFAGYISEDKKKSYNVQLIEVTSDQYTLKLGEATLTKIYSDYSENVKKTP